MHFLYVSIWILPLTSNEIRKYGTMYLPASQVPSYLVPLTFEILSNPKFFYEENKEKKGRGAVQNVIQWVAK